MKLTASLLAFFAIPVLGISIAYDPVYDERTTSLNAVACSDGSHGLERLGYTTFGSLPSFPNIGAAYAVADRNSPACGTCWRLTYTDKKGVSRSINITAVDHAGPNSFNIALAAMNTLTNNQAEALGRISVTSEQVHPSGCGLK